MSDRAPPLAFRDPAGRWVSEGRRLLEEARGRGPDRTKLLVMAMQLTTSEQHVGRLLRGLERPSIDMATRAWLAFEIPAHAWGLAPTNLAGSRSLSTVHAPRANDSSVAPPPATAAE